MSCMCVGREEYIYIYTYMVSLEKVHCTYVYNNTCTYVCNNYSLVVMGVHNNTTLYSVCE